MVKRSNRRLEFSQSLLNTSNSARLGNTSTIISSPRAFVHTTTTQLLSNGPYIFSRKHLKHSLLTVYVCLYSRELTVEFIPLSIDIFCFEMIFISKSYYTHELTLLGKTLAVARVLCPLVAREAALLIRRYSYCLAVTRARTRYC